MSGAGEAPARTEVEIVGATIAVTVGGRPRSIRVLSMAESRAWKVELFRSGKGVGKLDLSGPDSLEPVVTLVGDKVLDLVIAYDVDATLGGREYVFKTASDVEVYAIFRECLRVSFPFVPDLRTAVAEIRALGLVDLLQDLASSPSESSSSGEQPASVSASTGS